MQTKIVFLDKIDFSVEMRNQENGKSGLARSEGDQKTISWAIYDGDKRKFYWKNVFDRKEGISLILYGRIVLKCRTRLRENVAFWQHPAVKGKSNLIDMKWISDIAPTAEILFLLLH